MIEMYLLEQLVAVAKCGTLSLAADYLHMTQPALSKSMQKLENITEVNLFDHSKNRITITETGRLAAELASQILRQQENMITQLRHFDKGQHTISLGSCAPIPISDLVPLLSQHYPHFTVSTCLESDEQKLISDLLNDLYQLIVLSFIPDDKTLYIHEYYKEQLYLLVPKKHPLANYKELHFSDFDGQNILLYSEIGSWNDVAKRNLPHAHFMVMDSLSAMGTVFETGAFPAFTTDIVLNEQNDQTDNIIAIPILDDEATMHYYCICKKNSYAKYEKLFNYMKPLSHQSLQTNTF